MGRIQQLPLEIANKIAAGEVIERPASVVKELVENSIDAGATRIRVELEDAGKQLIRVSDDGHGMGPEDIQLCFKEHATSKLKTTDDLFYIDTMGFRGEALPSIASISHARAVSLERETGEAWEIECKGGRLTDLKPAAGARGTSIEVRNLFYNTPVRRKFLRQNSTEVSRCMEAIQRVALAYHQIGFSLSNDGREVLDLPSGQDRRTRVLEFAGGKLKDKLIEVNDFDEYAALTGFVGTVSEHRHNSKQLYLFVNQRFVRDRSLLHAVTMAYREYIPHGRYPIAFLFLELDPSEVDVNVHPTKIEVRFQQANRLFSKIKASVQEAVLRSGQLPRISLDDQRIEQLKTIGAQTTQAGIHSAMQDFLARAESQQAKRDPGPHIEARPDSQNFEADPSLGAPSYDDPSDTDDSSESGARPTLMPTDQLQRARSIEKPRYEQSKEVRANQAIRPAGDAGIDPVTTQREPDVIRVGSEQTPGDARQPSLLDKVRGLFQVGDMFIVVETDEGLIFIDQHAYHERVLYWQLEHRLQAEPPEVQRLLVPEPLELSREASELIHDHTELFREFGFLIEPFGSGGWACFGLPRYIKTSKVNEFVTSTLEEVAATGRPNDPASLRKNMVDMMACKAALKAGESLQLSEMESLLAAGARVPHTFACPHGRPTTFMLTFEDLEKFFHRK